MYQSEQSIPALPAETARLGRAILPAGHPYRMIGDQLEELLAGVNLSGLQPSPINGGWPLPPALLLMVTIFQYMEGLSDGQMAELTAVRLDWKYALHLPLDNPGLQEEVLVEFRQRLVTRDVGGDVFYEVLIRLVERGLCQRWGELLLLPDLAIDVDEIG
jgi:transposase